MKKVVKLSEKDLVSMVTNSIKQFQSAPEPTAEVSSNKVDDDEDGKGEDDEIVQKLVDKLRDNLDDVKYVSAGIIEYNGVTMYLNAHKDTLVLNQGGKKATYNISSEMGKHVHEISKDIQKNMPEPGEEPGQVLSIAEPTPEVKQEDPARSSLHKKLGLDEEAPEDEIEIDDHTSVENDLDSSHLVNIKLSTDGAKLLLAILSSPEIEYDDEDEQSLAEHLIIDLKAVLGEL